MVSFTRTCRWVTRKGFRYTKLVIILGVTSACIFLFKYGIPSWNEIQKSNISHRPKEKHVVDKQPISKNIMQMKDDLEFAMQKTKKITVEIKSPISTKKIETENKLSSKKQTRVCHNVHTFYYPWYGNPKNNKEYLHWNHRYLPHWNRDIAAQFRKDVHVPPDDVASNYYPHLGPYSSTDPVIIEEHMKQLQTAGIGVIAVSYYPHDMADDNGKDWQHVFPILLEYGEKYGINVAFHIEPYKDRTEASVKEDIINIIEEYSMFPAFYKFEHRGKKLPLIYIYDSYHTKSSSWARILKEGPESIRNTDHDAFVIGLLVEEKDQMEMVHAGFDGFYTYFASNGFTYGSTRHNWKHLGEFARANDLLYIPSIGPGYIDTRIRPWNAQNTRQRLKGKYYTESWTLALAENTEIISITSFNEWHEGSQIEKAIPKQIADFTYADYSPHTSEYYLQITRTFVEKFTQCRRTGIIY